MSISDDLKTVRINKPVTCNTCYYLDVMGVADAEKMRDALKKKKLYTHVDISDVFTNNGMPISETSIRRHRKHCM